MKVKVPKNIIEKYSEFAESCVNTNKGLYKNRNQRNIKKIVSDILNGKIGEYGAYVYLKENNLKPNTMPDIEIYGGRKKSFSADLSVGDIPVHIKSQSTDSAEKYGMSWTFQYDGRTDTGNKKKNHRDPVIDNPDGLLVFCTVDSENYAVEVQAALPTKNCIPTYLELPKLEYLKDFKRVVYYKTLKENFKDLFSYEELLNVKK